VERWVAHVVSAALVACVLLPLTWPAERDSFPLSNYPMFARQRRSPVVKAVYAIAVDESGARHWVSPSMVANLEPLQARAVLDRAARGGKPAVEALCRSIAGRVAAAGGELAGAVELRILRGSHDAIAYFEEGVLGKERVLGRCPVRAEGAR
jgi:hypothetical protein